MSEEDFAYNTCMRIDPRIKCHNVLRRLRDLGHMFRLFTPFFNIAFSINDFKYVAYNNSDSQIFRCIILFNIHTA